ncbi:MAG: hypothetical protein M3539_12230, partial [Acidobacteriota bacterium]|nr:hypothetical protein [Acidobacteriota bacterium]
MNYFTKARSLSVLLLALLLLPLPIAHQQTVDGQQQTANRSQKTEDRRQKTEVRRQKLEVSVQQSALQPLSRVNRFQSGAQDPKPTPPQEPTKKDDRGLGVQAASPSPTPQAANSKQQTADSKKEAAGGRPQAAGDKDQAAGGRQQVAGQSKPEMVLQAGITSPQTQISFSPDGRLLASMGIGGNAIKLWEVASGRLVRQLESSIPSMGTSSMSRPFRFSVDGKTLTAFADGRLQRWDVETGRELNNTLLTTAKDLIFVFLSDDGSTLAALNMNNSGVRLWDANSGRELRAVAFEEDEQLGAQNAFALSPDGKLLAALTQTFKASMKGVETKRQVTMFEVASGRKTQTVNLKTTNAQLGFSPTGSYQTTSLA